MTDLPTTCHDRVICWVDDAIIGLNLCPFARSVRPDMRVAVRPEAGLDNCIEAVLDEVRQLLDDPDLTTTLVVFEHGLMDFEHFLDAADAVEHTLAESGADAWVQIASFHPHYQFEGTAPNDVSNATNRSPYPIIHLLRTEAVSAVIDKHPDTLAIPEANVARLEALGIDEVRRRWARFLP